MTFSDEMLMAYVDHELDATAAGAIDAAIARDPELAARVERQRRLRNAVHATYEPVLHEPMPKRLLEAARGTAAEPPAMRPARWTWFQWGSVAASLVLGVVIGATLLGDLRREPVVVAEFGGNVVTEQGRLFAGGHLAHALTDQLASTQRPDAPVRIGLTFLARTGEYCRTFTLQKGAMPESLAGLACHDPRGWRIQVIAQDDRPAKPGEYRMAGVELPPAVLRSVEERMQDNTLDAEAERAARQRGWKR